MARWARLRNASASRSKVSTRDSFGTMRTRKLAAVCGPHQGLTGGRPGPFKLLASHQSAGKSRSRGIGTTLLASEAMTVAATHAPTVTKRLRAKRNGAHKPRTRSPYATAPRAETTV
jgi:hypothetical protein